MKRLSHVCFISLGTELQSGSLAWLDLVTVLTGGEGGLGILQLLEEEGVGDSSTGEISAGSASSSSILK